MEAGQAQYGNVSCDCRLCIVRPLILLRNDRVKEIAVGLEPGKHTLTCEILEDTLDPMGGTEFRLFAIMHD